MKFPLLPRLFVLCMISPLAAQEAADAAALMRKLKSDDMEVRLDSIRDLQTSLDPGIPEACLSLLKEGEGATIRRLAVRSIGSRW